MKEREQDSSFDSSSLQEILEEFSDSVRSWLIPGRHLARANLSGEGNRAVNYIFTGTLELLKVGSYVAVPYMAYSVL